MIRRIKQMRRRRATRAYLKRHASEIIVGVVMGLATDLVTDALRSMIARKSGRWLRRA